MKFAMLFPGQGSQSVGMLEAWSGVSARVRETLDEAESVLGPDLLTLMREGPSCRLDKTENTQPAMLIADVALFRVWVEAGGPLPVAVAGHSLGEYAALVAAGAVSFSDALKLVQERALAMRDAVPDGAGAMAAVVGLDDAEVQQVCDAVNGQIEAVNFNAPTQIVIAGETAAIDEACERAKEFGARMIRKLPVSVPAHSQMMRAARERLGTAMQAAEFQAPVFPVVQNVDAQAHAQVDQLRAVLLDQVHSPVRWVDTQQVLHQQFDCQTALECGPGNVLAGLGRRSGVGMSVSAFPAPESLQETIERFSREAAE